MATYLKFLFKTIIIMITKLSKLNSFESLMVIENKPALKVGWEKDLVPTLELIKTAVLYGELDTQIEAAANKLRDGFAQ